MKRSGKESSLLTKILIIAAGKLIAQGRPEGLRDKVSAESRLIAEIRGPAQEVNKAVRQLDGVESLELAQSDGWNRLSIVGRGKSDIREPLAKLIGQHGWGLRELRREVASLEDFFVKITAQQVSADR